MILDNIKVWTQAVLQGKSTGEELDDVFFADLKHLIDFTKAMINQRRTSAIITYSSEGEVSTTYSQEDVLVLSRQRANADKEELFDNQVGYTANLPNSHNLRELPQADFVRKLAHHRAVINPVMLHSYGDEGVLQYDYWGDFSDDELRMLSGSFGKFLPQSLLVKLAKKPSEILNWSLNDAMMENMRHINIALRAGQYNRFVEIYNEVIHRHYTAHYLALAIRPSQPKHLGLSHMAWGFVKKLIEKRWLNPSPGIVAYDRGVMRISRLPREELIQRSSIMLDDDESNPPWAAKFNQHPQIYDLVSAWLNQIIDFLVATKNYDRFAEMVNKEMGRQFPTRRDLQLELQGGSHTVDDRSFSTKELCRLLNNTAVALERRSEFQKSYDLYHAALELVDRSERHRILYNLARHHRRQSQIRAEECLQLVPDFSKASQLL